MSTLEKLLVLGVLVLVGVILAISLFWSRPDVANAKIVGFNEPTLTLGDPNRPPVTPSTLDRTNPGAQSRPADAVVNGAEVAQQPTAQPEAKPLTTTMMMKPFDPTVSLRPSASADFSLYVVSAGDNPEVISKKLIGNAAGARAIDRANEGRKLVPKGEILIPNSIFEQASSAPANVANNPNKPLVTNTNPSTVTVGPELDVKSAATDAKSVAKNADPKKSDPKKSVVAKDSAASKDAAKDAGEHLYVVKAGDNLRRIAKAQLKDDRRWKEIQTLNHLPTDAIREGQKLKLPAPK